MTGEGTEEGQGPADPGTPPGIVALVSLSLRRERARAALSLTELARRAGIAKSTLSQLENGTGNPSIETLWALGKERTLTRLQSVLEGIGANAL